LRVLVEQKFQRIGGADIYYTYVKQKRKGVTYLPMVNYDGWPVPTLKRDKKPEPVRFGKVPLEVNNTANPLVVIELEQGDVLVELFEDVVPNTVKNFLNLVQERFYDIDCEFYRVEGTGSDIAEIYRSGGLRIIQGGNDQSKSRDKYDYNIRNEAVDNSKYDAFFGLDRGGVANVRGTIAMARTSDLDGAGQEFFINLKDMPEWDRKSSPYCVFGRVLEGLDLCAKVTKDDPILSIKVIRRRDTQYVPEVKYKTEGVWKEKNAVTPPSEDDIKKAREEAKKKRESASAAPAPSSMPNLDFSSFGR
ncbi:MAG: peptidylprolyl isomerase, partial [Planctomycetes bacterium]|nr:peptidylprolyl isomerase [Planctomycetota bacterium]